MLIWLGNETEQDRGALHELDRLHEILSGVPEDEARLIRRSYGNDEWLSLIRTVAKVQKEPIGYLLELPWFQRAWVIQEAANAKVAIMMHRQETLLWNKFAFVVQKMKEYQFVPGWRNRYIADTFQHVASTIANPISRTELFLLLSFARNFYCSTDPRDRLYALLGLAQDTSRTHVIPDYRKSPEQVFREFTISELQRGSIAHLSATTYLQDDSGYQIGLDALIDFLSYLCEYQIYPLPRQLAQVQR